jgi:hypothetical protein
LIVVIGASIDGEIVVTDDELSTTLDDVTSVLGGGKSRVGWIVVDGGSALAASSSLPTAIDIGVDVGPLSGEASVVDDDIPGAT